MKTKTKVLSAGLLLYASSLASAAPVTATFSYNFGAGNVLTGSLSGELHDGGTASILDDYIDGVTDLTAQFNGVHLRGPLFFSAYDGRSGRRDDLPARMYLAFTTGPRGFLVANCADGPACATAALSDYNYFLFRNGGTEYAQFFDRLTGQPDVRVSGYSFVAPEWQLAVTPNVVPEPGGLTLAFLGLTAVAGLRRRRAAKSS